MKKAALLSLALASCALPPNVSVANRVMLDGARASFQSCSLSVQFSGTPRELHANEAARYTSGLGKSARWQVDGLVYEQFSLSQTAICACRDAEFSNADIRQAELALARNPNIKMLPVATPRYVRGSIGIDAPYGRGGDVIGDQALLLFPVNARRCVFIQGGQYLPTAPDALKGFYATLEPIGK
ncbi:MAG TPA: hypothetical protein VM140_10315 [Burkholderiales bacterium]|nr:hypothetical protein [Burkholderiales bacterium]